MDTLQGYSSDESAAEDYECLKRHNTDAKVVKVKQPVAKTSKLGAEYLFGLSPKKPLLVSKTKGTSDDEKTDILERIRQKPRVPLVEPSDTSEQDKEQQQQSDGSDNADAQTVEFSVDSFYQQNNKLIDSGDLDSAKLEKENKKLRYYGVGPNQLSEVLKFNDKRKERDDI